GAAFAWGELQSTFSTTARLERSLGLPVLGAISQSLSPAAHAQNKRKTRHFYAAASALGGVFILLLAMEHIHRGIAA
ncbi:MAG TPA: chain-length determining protein, partial [Novosphingobium sp.]|nr:chain-length determining protein [Novosphingobium sp.]